MTNDSLYNFKVYFFIFQDIADTTIPQLVQGIRATMSAPDSSAAQMQLINAAQNMLQVQNTGWCNMVPEGVI